MTVSCYIGWSLLSLQWKNQRWSSATLVLGLVALVVLSGPAYAEERLALLIGNQAYTKEVGPLENPINDINLVGTALEEIGFKVETVEDAGSGDLHEAVNKYVRILGQAGPDAVGFFYYSGHGAADPDTNVNYLIPVDVKDADEEGFWDKSVKLKKLSAILAMTPPMPRILSSSTPAATNCG